MRAVTRILGMVGLLAVGAAGSALAQRAQTREGFWIGFGFGYGSSSLSCGSSCSFTDASKGGGGAGFLKMGGTLNSKVLLGGEVNGWVKDVSGVTEQIGNVSAALYLYPAPTSGFFVKGGAGFSTYMLRNSGSSVSANGFGLIAGLGYDIRVGRMISLSPTGNFYWGSDGDLKDGGATVIPSVKHTIFDFGLGITFH